MLDYIEKLQQKPEAARRRILYLSVFAIMATIVLIWASTLSFRFEGVQNPESEKERQNESSLVAPLLDKTSGYYRDFERGLQRIREMF